MVKEKSKETEKLELLWLQVKSTKAGVLACVTGKSRDLTISSGYSFSLYTFHDAG